jgi:hypothetical protein
LGGNKLMFENESEMMTKIRELKAKISQRFEYFNNLYKDMHFKRITEEKFYEKLREKINTLTDNEMEEYNEMWSMLSTKNCEWSEYAVGEIVHEELIKKWCPENMEG